MPHSAITFFLVLLGLAALGIIFIHYIMVTWPKFPKCNQCDKNTYHHETATQIYTTCNGKCIKTCRD